MTIYVVMHKPVPLPAGLDAALYRPLQVGAAGRVPFAALRDDTGENISPKNASYNELTGLYWIWKNSREDVVGLCHYRRYFVSPVGKLRNFFTGRCGDFLTRERITEILRDHDIIVHNPTYFLQGVRRQFEETQSAENLAVLESVIAEQPPAYQAAFAQQMAGKKIHLLNLFIAKKPLADRYAAWLFPVLEETERRILKKNPHAEMDRAMGMLAERLPDVFIRANNLRCYECFTVNTERVDRSPW